MNNFKIFMIVGYILLITLTLYTLVLNYENTQLMIQAREELLIAYKLTIF